MLSENMSRKTFDFKEKKILPMISIFLLLVFTRTQLLAQVFLGKSLVLLLEALYTDSLHCIGFFKNKNPMYLI